MFTKDECSSKCLEGEEDDFLLYYAINSFVMRLNWRNFSSCSRVTCKTSIHDLYPPSPSSSPLFLMKHVAALYYKVLLAKKLNSKLCLSWKYYVLKGPSILRKKCAVMPIKNVLETFQKMHRNWDSFSSSFKVMKPQKVYILPRLLAYQLLGSFSVLLFKILERKTSFWEWNEDQLTLCQQKPRKLMSI